MQVYSDAGATSLDSVSGQFCSYQIGKVQSVFISSQLKVMLQVSTDNALTPSMHTKAPVTLAGVHWMPLVNKCLNAARDSACTKYNSTYNFRVLPPQHTWPIKQLDFGRKRFYRHTQTDYLFLVIHHRTTQSTQCRLAQLFFLVQKVCMHGVLKLF